MKLTIHIKLTGAEVSIGPRMKVVLIYCTTYLEAYHSTQYLYMKTLFIFINRSLNYINAIIGGKT